MHDKDELAKALVEAQSILLLGFGYHATNLDLIKTAPASSAASVLGTFVGVHSQNLEVITSQNYWQSPGSTETRCLCWKWRRL